MTRYPNPIGEFHGPPPDTPTLKKYGEGEEFVYQGPPFTNDASEKTRPLEKHYSAADIAAIWGLSVDKVRELFRVEPDVLAIDKTGRNKYVTLRVPESVLIRGHRRLSQQVRG